MRVFAGISAPLLAVLALGTAAAQAAPPAGATSCTGCHAEGQLSLKHLTAEEIAGALAAFRSGEREATLMDRIAKGFTAEESAAIAAWLARE
jgi:cytochrome subunit of sulfide dehydrogenase